MERSSSLADRLSDDDGAALWTGGLAAAVGLATAAVFPDHGAALERAAYVALGAGVPALAFALVFAPAPAAARKIKAALTALFLAFAAFYLAAVLRRLEWEALAGAAIVTAWLARFSGRSFKSLAPAFLACAAGFVCALRLFWWTGGWSTLKVREPFAPLLLAASALAVCAVFLPGKNATRLKPGLWDVPAVILFALGAARVSVDPHDGAFLAGTVALLRGGARLLWDAPSQYGFLNMALAALVPVSSPWRAVYWINAPLLFASACAVYAALRLISRGRWAVPAAGLLAWAAVLGAPGRIWLLDGPNASPSVGAFRFLWCYVLLGWAAALHLRRKSGAGLKARELVPGIIAWALGCLWSFESAVYSTAAAWPVFLLAFAELRSRRKTKEAALSLLAPPAALASALAAVAVFYRLRFGHGPDWLCFVEYPLAYAGGFGSLPLNPAGAVAALVWAGILIVAAAAVALKRSSAAKWLIVPAFSTFWATASYFVSRSHDNNVLNLAPLWLSALLAAFLAADEDLPEVRTLRAAAVPLAAGLLTAVLCDPARLRAYAVSLVAGPGPAALDRLLPSPGPEIESLLDRAGAGPGERVAFFWPYLLERTTVTGGEPALVAPWLAVAPAAQFSILSAPRRELYLRRSLARETAGASGWILEPKEFDRPDLKSLPVAFFGQDLLVNPRASGLEAALLDGGRAEARFESENWRLTRYRRN